MPSSTMTKTLNMVQGGNWKYSGETIEFIYEISLWFSFIQKIKTKKSWTS